MKAYKLKRGMFCFARSFLFSFFSRCGRFISRKILPFCLSLTVLFSVFALPSYAEGGNLINSNITDSSWSWVSDQYTFNPTLYYNTSTTATRFTIPSNPSGSYAIRYTEIPRSSVYPNHNYQISFDVYGDFSKCNLAIEVDVNTGNGGGAYLVQIHDNFNSGDNVYTHGVINFVPSNINSNVQTIILKLVFVPVQNSSVNLYVKNLTLIDTSDNDGLLSGILDWISRIYHSIAGGTDSQGVYHQGLVAGIGSALNVVKTAVVNAINNVEDWLTSVKEGINTKLEAVKTAISNSIAGIQQWFIDLKNNIINGLKSLFVPSAEFWDETVYEFDNFASTHFGVVYQVGDLIAGFIRLLTRLNPSLTHTITMPAIEFEFQGQTWHLSDAQTYSFDWVYDSSHPLSSIYLIYRTIVYLILLFLFLDFCHKKYNQVINNFNPDTFDM